MGCLFSTYPKDKTKKTSNNETNRVTSALPDHKEYTHCCRDNCTYQIYKNNWCYAHYDMELNIRKYEYNIQYAGKTQLNNAYDPFDPLNPLNPFSIYYVMDNIQSTHNHAITIPKYEPIADYQYAYSYEPSPTYRTS